MQYRLEDQLPLDAEQLTADFLEMAGGASGGGGQEFRGLGVAIETQRLAPTLVALDEESIPIACICPLELLAWQQVQGEAVAAEQGNGLCLIQHERELHLFAPLAHPRCWRRFPAKAADLQRQLRRQRLSVAESPAVVAVGVDESLIEAAQAEAADGAIKILDGPDAIERAMLAADAVTRQGRSAPVNLRRDALAAPDRLQQVRRPLTAVLVALALMLAVLGGALQWQTHHHRQQTDVLHERQQALYREAFPGRDVPLAVLASLRSETDRLRGMSGASDQLPQRVSALHLLQAALERLPRELRYRVLELRLDGQRLYLDGQARSHSGADAVAAALRQDRVFVIEPPRTESLPERGVSFTLTGRPRQIVPLEPEGGGR